MSTGAGATLADIAAGTALGPIEITVSAAANERYWAAAGVDHPVLRAGALYPPIAANLTILLFQTVATRGVLQTAQRLVCHRRGEAGTPLTVSGTVTRALREAGPRVRRRRGDRHPPRRCAAVDVGRHLLRAVRETGPDDADPIAARHRRAAAGVLAARQLPLRPGGGPAPRPRPRSSPRGCRSPGPRTGSLLDEWGEDFLAHGELELKFVGRVVEGDTADAAVDVDGDDARRSRCATGSGPRSWARARRTAAGE